MVNCRVCFKVILRDESGEFCGGDHILSAHITSGCKRFTESLFASSGQNQGIYSFSYTPIFPSEFTLNILVNDNVLDQMCFKLLAINIPYPSNCSVRGLGTKQATKNTVAHFEVFLADKDGSPINALQSVTANLKLLSSPLHCIVLPMQVVCHLASVYSVAYMPSVCGKCPLTVFVNDIPLCKPLIVTVVNSNFSSLGGAANHGELMFIKLLVQQGGQLSYVSI